MQRIIDGYFTCLKLAIVACLAIMVILVFGNVVLRYAFNMGITVSEELSRFLFVWLTFLGAIVAFREHGHLGVDMVVSRLPAVGKKACLVVSQVLMLFVTWLFLQGSWEQTLINLDVKSPVGRDFDGHVLRCRHHLQRLGRHHPAARSVSRGHRQDLRGGAGDGQGVRGAGGVRGAAEGSGGPGRRPPPRSTPTKSR